ncbi:MAG TPA: hypothetical protein VHJ20_06400 [Polyangia bacterium]|nr:hypothetical protein [Polyangia bacterium]
MMKRLPILLTGMIVGAGLLHGASVLYDARKPAHAADRAVDGDVAAPAAEAPAPALAAAAVRLAAAAPDANLAARLEHIEQRLDGLATSGEARRAEQARAEETLTGGATPEDREPQQQTAFDRAQTIVDGAIRGGLWTDNEQSAMREVAATLLPADRFALKMKLSVAGNDGKLRDTASQPMFF